MTRSSRPRNGGKRTRNARSTEGRQAAVKDLPPVTVTIEELAHKGEGRVTMDGADRKSVV